MEAQSHTVRHGKGAEHSRPGGREDLPGPGMGVPPGETGHRHTAQVPGGVGFKPSNKTDAAELWNNPKVMPYGGRWPLIKLDSQQVHILRLHFNV